MYRHVFFSCSPASIAELVWACLQEERVWVLTSDSLPEEEKRIGRSVVGWIQDRHGSLMYREDGKVRPRISTTRAVTKCVFSFEDGIDYLMEWAGNQYEGTSLDRENVDKLLSCVAVCDGKDAFAFWKSCGECKKCQQVRLRAEKYGMYDLL